jgi:hypothetical protein
MTPKVKHRHHVVSRFYLRRFADGSDRIMRVPYDGSKPRNIGTRNATVQTNFYRLEVKGERPDAFEEALSAVEKHAAPAIARLLDDRRWPISPEDRYHIASWVALQFLRSQATRTRGEEIARSISKLQVGVATTQQLREDLGLPVDKSDDEVESIRAAMMSTADARSVETIHHLGLVAQSLENVTNLVYHRRPWVLTMWTRKGLATSDTPVVLVPQNHERNSGTGIGNAAEIIVPMGRREALTFGKLGGSRDDFRIPGNARLAITLNKYVLWNARREAFHHPHDEPFAGLTIPETRQNEVTSPSGQIHELIQAFAAQQNRPHGLPQRDR